MTALEAFADLEIHISAPGTDDYPVHLRLNGKQEFPSGYLPADILPWTSSGDPAADGQRLLDALLADAGLRSAWDRACGRAPRRRVRLWIDKQAPKVHTLPWELLHERGVWLAAQAVTPFSRYLPSEKPWDGPVAACPLRVLVAISSPDDLEQHHLAPLDVEQEREILEHGVQASGLLDLTFLDAPITLERLEAALRQGQDASGYHILHFLGHGAFSQRRDETGIYLQNEAGGTQVVTAQELVAMLGGLDELSELPRLVFLAACESATRSTTDAFLGLAPQLVRQAGVPAVVAMQHNVKIATARKLGVVFYQRLAAHGVVDLALNEARRTLLTAGRPDAVVPVLFMRLEDGRLFDVADARLDPTTARDLFGPAMRLVNLVDVVPASDEQVRWYHEGAPLTWNVIAAGGDVERDCCGALVADLSAPTGRTRILCLSGEPGAGKSSLAWRVAARVAQTTGQPLLHVRDNEAADAWYYLESGVQQYAAPLIVLADDVFRNDDARRALASLRPDLSVTIIVTSRSNEIPDDLRLPFPLQIVELGAPTSDEKTRVLRKLGLDERKFTAAQRQRLRDANSWLVMMLETTTGEELVKIVRHSVNRLKQQDEVVYRAYEYLCYAGQYDLAVPESLIAALDERGRFYNLLERRAGKGLLLKDDRWEGSLRTLHSTIACEALKVYNRDPRVLAREFIAALQPARREQRLFLTHWLRRLILDRQEQFVRCLLEQSTGTIDTVLAACGVADLVYRWVPLYRMFGEQQRIAEVEVMALDKAPETPHDWRARLNLLERRGTGEQIAALIDTTAEWLAANPPDAEVRRHYLGLVERCGTGEQIAALIDTTAEWLAANPQNTSVRTQYLGVLKRRGTREQMAALIDATGEWLAINPQDTNVRQTYLGLVEQRGTGEQIAALIDGTAEWLAANPQDTNVRERYLGLVERRGTGKQIATLIAATDEWLVANPQDTNVRPRYLGLVEQRGTGKQIATLIDATAEWLAANPQGMNVRERYLGLVEQCGTEEQIEALIDTTSEWLSANLQDTNARRRHLGLVEQRGTVEQIAALIDATAEWLDANPQDTNVRTRYFGLVEQHGTGEQIAALIDTTDEWLAANPQDVEVRRHYLGLVERRGTGKQIAALIDATAEWLAANPWNTSVRERCFGLVERRGTGKQIAALIDTTDEWLVVNLQDTNVRVAYLGLVERRGTGEQIAALIDATTEWLAATPQDMNVRRTYLGLVERRGTGEQIAALIDITSEWLAVNPQDIQVRTRYLGLMEQHGTAEQIAVLIDTTSEWLAVNLQDTNVRCRYLGLVERRGMEKQIVALIDTTSEWLTANPQDVEVRRHYLGLVEQRGTEEQIAALIDTTAEWLFANPQDTNVRVAYLGLVRHRGTAEQSARACELTRSWLRLNPKTRNTWMLNNYGRVLSKLERHPEAEDQFRHALRIHKGLVPVRVGLAWSLYHQGKKRKALGKLEHVKRLAKKKSKTYPVGAALHHLGRYYLLEGDLERATSYFQQAIDDSPEHYGNYWQLGRVLLAQERYAEALAAFESARERLPDNFSDEDRAELEELVELARSGIGKR